MIRTLGVTTTPISVPRHQLNAVRFMSAATAGAAMVIPVTSLTDPDQLKLRVVDPALVAVAELA